MAKEPSPTSCVTIHFPSNHTFLSFPLVLTHNNTHLFIDSNTTLLASNDIDAWPFGGDAKSNFNNFVDASNLCNISVYGNDYKLSTIDGNGAKWYSLYANRSLPHTRPRFINIVNPSNIQLFNPTILNLPMF